MRNELLMRAKTFVRRNLGTIGYNRFIEFAILLNWSRINQGETVCDVACGSGSLAYRISKRGAFVYGIDSSLPGIRDAKLFESESHGRCAFVVSSAEWLPFREGSFDAVVCNSSLEHFVDDLAALREMHRVLKSRGRVVLIVDSLSNRFLERETISRHQKAAFVNNYYTSQSLRAKMEHVGFGVLKTRYYFGTRVSALFFVFNLRLGYRAGIQYAVLSLIALPFTILSESLPGKQSGGLDLAVEAVK